MPLCAILRIDGISNTMQDLADLQSLHNEYDTWVYLPLFPTVPGKVQGLACAKSPTSSALTFYWELPTLLGEEVIDYLVEVKELRHRDGTRDVIQVDVDGFNTAMKQATVNQGLVGEVPFSISVKALTVAGCGPEQQIYCFTHEGDSPAPMNVVVVRFDSTSIGVSWTKYTLVELKGLANYTVTYNIIIGSRKRQLGGTVTVPWTENRVIISNLQPGAEYDVTVSTSTTAGTSQPVGPSSMTDSTNNSITIIVGGVVAGVVAMALIIAGAIVIIIYMYLRRRKDEFKPNQSSEPYLEPGVVLNSTSQTKPQEATEGDHEYELLDKYSQPQGPETTPTKSEQQKTSSAGDYEFTHCPAYVPVTHGNQETKTSLTQQPTTVSADDDGMGEYEMVSPN